MDLWDWGGEFGRTPMYEVRLASPEPGKEGRDHHALAFSMWAVLHCLGLDHTRLTYRHQGRDFRLTDVAVDVVHEVLT